MEVAGQPGRGRDMGAFCLIRQNIIEIGWCDLWSECCTEFMDCYTAECKEKATTKKIKK